ncbi:MAG: endonuclease/exonuclease/phosphatase family metal-dependent hydrolase [Pseudorhodobacter sp.]|jgi:endonuclease/exonuclease/phosphatase family metal-dependent hydrolase
MGWMRRSLNVVGLFGLGISLLACALHMSNSGTASPVTKPEGALRIASYNVHYILLGQASGAWSVDDWDRRKAPLDDAFKAVGADVIAFQEMESFARGDNGSVNLTLDYVLAQNPDYAAAAVGDYRVFPSTQPILYRKAAMRLMDQGWFFFSDTPDVIYSRTFNGSFPAFASWAKFAPQTGGPEFYVYNVHFEYKSRANRSRSAQLVRARMAPVIAAGAPVFLVGDLNNRAGAGPVAHLEEGGLRFAPVAGSTYHFNRGLSLFGAIDHLGSTANLKRAAGPYVLRQKFRGEWPTDHYPVFADYLLP